MQVGQGRFNGLAGLQLASLGISHMPKASLGIGALRMLGGRQNCCRDRKANSTGYIVAGSRLQKSLVRLGPEASGR